MYTTRRYAACIRDLDYTALFYPCNAGDPSILDERTQRFEGNLQLLGCSIGATVQSIQAIATASLVGPDAGKEMGVYQTTSALA